MDEETGSDCASLGHLFLLVFGQRNTVRNETKTLGPKATKRGAAQTHADVCPYATGVELFSKFPTRPP